MWLGQCSVSQRSIIIQDEIIHCHSNLVLMTSEPHPDGFCRSNLVLVTSEPRPDGHCRSNLVLMTSEPRRDDL